MSKSTSQARQKVKVKEARSGKASAPGIVEKLFGFRKSESKNLPTVQSPKPSITPKVDPIRLAETIVTERGPAARSRPDVTSPSRLQNQKVASAPLSSSKKPTSKTRQSAKTDKNRILMFALLIGIVGYGLSELRGGKPSNELAIDEEAVRAAEQALQDRVQFHRNLMGGKLNRDRIEVEVVNQVTAARLPTLVKPVKSPDVMAGLPMVAESIHPSPSRDRLEASNPDFADSRIMYTLQEQQAANDWEDKARQQYIDEFVANATRAGYRVRVDSNGVVTIIGRTGAVEAGQLPRLPSGSGVAR